jgi:hypothetical protein
MIEASRFRPNVVSYAWLTMIRQFGTDNPATRNLGMEYEKTITATARGKCQPRRRDPRNK